MADNELQMQLEQQQLMIEQFKELIRKQEVELDRKDKELQVYKIENSCLFVLSFMSASSFCYFASMHEHQGRYFWRGEILLL